MSICAKSKKQSSATIVFWASSLISFSFSEEVGPGLPLWHPKGALLRHLAEQFSKEAHLLNDYEWVITPHIGKAKLWETSGHLDFYRENMYRPMDIEGDEYFLKPMNCPFHIHIYSSKLRSYRQLPVRMAEFGTVYRYHPVPGVRELLVREASSWSRALKAACRAASARSKRSTSAISAAVWPLAPA